MNFHPEANGRVWVDLRADEVYAFAANWPDFGPKCRAISLEISVADGDVYRWIGVEDGHSDAAIMALGLYAWGLLPSRNDKPWWRAIAASFKALLQHKEKA